MPRKSAATLAAEAAAAEAAAQAAADEAAGAAGDDPAPHDPPADGGDPDAADPAPGDADPADPVSLAEALAVQPDGGVPAADAAAAAAGDAPTPEPAPQVVREPGDHTGQAVSLAAEFVSFDDGTEWKAENGVITVRVN